MWIGSYYVSIWKKDIKLSEGMNKIEKEKKFLSDKKIRWTKLNIILKLKERKNKESSLLGVNNFKTNIILTMIFNKKFNNIELNVKTKILFLKY